MNGTFSCLFSPISNVFRLFDHYIGCKFYAAQVIDYAERHSLGYFVTDHFLTFPACYAPCATIWTLIQQNYFSPVIRAPQEYLS